MPRYYFDIDDGEGLTRDEEGILCRRREDLRRVATHLLPGIARDAPPNKDSCVLTVKVRDKSGDYVFQATLSLTAEWLDEKPETR
jgi:hypothetical protein